MPGCPLLDEHDPGYPVEAESIEEVSPKQNRFDPDRKLGEFTVQGLARWSKAQRGYRGPQSATGGDGPTLSGRLTNSAKDAVVRPEPGGDVDVNRL